MSFNQVFYILLRRLWIILLTFVFALLVAGAVLAFVPGRFDAIATASVDAAANPLADVGSSSATAIGLMQGNLTELVQSERVALDVVKRLNLAAGAQEDFRRSDSFGRQSIDEWMAAAILRNVEPKFMLGSNVLQIRYKAGDPNQAALIANAFLASSIDASIAMKAASGDQTARWFEPQLDDLRKDLQKARVDLESFQSRTNVVAPTMGSDTESATLAAITQDLSNNRAFLAALQSRLDSGSTDLANDPSDPDLQFINTLKVRIASSESEIETAKNSLGPNNPKMVAASSNLASLRKQLAEATEKSKQHLKEKIASVQSQLASVDVSQAQAQKALIAAQAQRDRLADLQRDVAFKLDELNGRERATAQARLQSKLTFADIAPLDKAVPPISPAFPKPIIVMPAAIAGGLALGIILALIAEATDRRVRFPADFRVATSAPILGVIQASRAGRRTRLLPAG